MIAGLETAPRAAIDRQPPDAGGIALRNLSHRYGATLALDDVTADFAPNQIHGLLGGNGAGKTTLMSLICNHIFCQSGSIRIDGQNPAENAALLERTCFVRENQRYSDAAAPRHLLATLPTFYPNWDAELAQRLVQRFRLPLKTSANKLSRGQRSALAIVIALASGADYTFLDEPYLGLDPSARAIFYEELLREFTRRPRTVVMSTHLIDEAADLMDTVVVIDEGRVVLQASVDDARNSAFVARGMAEDVNRLLDGREVLTEKQLGRIVSATVQGTPTEADEVLADELRVSLEPASLQELVAAIGLRNELAPGHEE